MLHATFPFQLYHPISLAIIPARNQVLKHDKKRRGDIIGEEF
ncbi:hypothetical protein ANO14919_008860 [Xylariales sp. No.14919]|nr:hypothetical protein ANO14919_008860 [Xylariales sp. No.14919]